MNSVVAESRSVSEASPEQIALLIEHFASITEPGSGPGVTRLGYSPLERRAHRVFAEYMTDLGLDVRVDGAGNTIAVLHGRGLDGSDDSLGFLSTGSHLDSVPRGGRFDGIAGVVAGMEVARAMVRDGLRLRHSVQFVAFACEEGARFGQACLGSRIAAGLTGPKDLERLVDADGISVADAMRSVDLDPTDVSDSVWRPTEHMGFVELHIEQGSVLDEAEMPIGVVDLISGSTRIKIGLTGRASHTGGTPMHLRADALTAAAEIILDAETRANEPRFRGARISVGKLTVLPGSITTIPGECELFVDVRDVDSDRQRVATSEVISRAYAIATERGIGIEITLLGDASPVVLPLRIRQAVIDSARSLGLDYRVMPSGASHDTAAIDRICPGALIFVPSENHGVSHCPEEFTSFADIARGANMLASSLIRLDRAGS